MSVFRKRAFQSCVFVAGLLLGPAIALGQATSSSTSSDASPMTAALVPQYEEVRDYVLKAAREMPAADYGYRPTTKVRTFGQLVGHVAEMEYGFCSGIRGEATPHQSMDADQAASKADLVKALTAAFAYCDTAYHAVHDAGLSEPVLLFGESHSRLYTMVANIGHVNEHYGNMVVYLRARGLVPPSSMPK